MKKYTQARSLVVVFFVLLVFLPASAAFAQAEPTDRPVFGFSGPQTFPGQFGYGYGVPGQMQTVTVNQVRTFGHKMPVVINGNIVQFYGGKDLYLFRDSSGEVIIKIGQKEWQNLWYQGINIGPNDRVEIFGEVHWPKRGWGGPEVHARFIRKI